MAENNNVRESDIRENTVRVLESNLPILKRDNWGMWSFRMRLYLRARGLESYINNASGSVEKSQIVYSHMVNCCDEENVKLIMQSGTSFEAWKRLTQVHQNKTPQEKHQIWKNLFRTKITKASEVQTTVAELQNLAAQLKVLDEKVSEACIMSIIMEALPIEFKPFLASWATHEDQSFERFIKHLDNQTRELMMNGEQTDNVALANQSNYKRKNFYKGKPSRPQDKDSKDSANETVSEKFEGTCNYCKKYGHRARDCRKRKNNFNRNKSETANVASEIAFMAFESSIDKEQWVSDSGSSLHLTCNKHWLREYQPLQNKVKIKLGKGEITADGVGTVVTTNGSIGNVFYAPELWTNLFSIRQAAKKGFSVEYTGNTVKIMKNKKLVMTGSDKGSGVYCLDTQVIPASAVSCMASSIDDWHKRFGHISADTVKQMMKTDAVKGLLVGQNKKGCGECAAGKIHRTNHPTRMYNRVEQPANSLHVDTVGPIAQRSLGGSKYFVLCKDEVSGFRMVQLIPSKEEIWKCISFFVNQAEFATGNKVFNIHTDNGTEYVNHRVRSFCEEKGIKHLTSAPYTPQQNGYIERDVRTVTDMARSMMSNSKVPKDLWAEAVAASVYTVNRVINSRSGNKTPFELWHNRKPDVSNLRIFGQSVAVLDLSHYHSKWDDKTVRGYLVGYTDRTNTYRIYNSKSRTVGISCNIILLKKEEELEGRSPTSEESIIPVEMEIKELDTELSNASDQNENLRSDESQVSNQDINQINDQYDDNEDGDSHATFDVQQRPSKGIKRSHETFRIDNEYDKNDEQDVNIQSKEMNDQGEFNDSLLNPVAKPYIHFSNAASDTHPIAKLTDQFFKLNAPSTSVHIVNPANKAPRALLTMIDANDDPTSYKAAMKRPDANKWKDAMIDEMKSFEKCKVWDLVDRPRDQNVVTNRWVLRVKRKPTGEVERYRARLVARGFTQVEGVDYKETYSPVVNTTFIRILFALAARLNLLMAGFDIKTAFLNGDLEEEVFMEQPEGFVKQINKVCKLKRSLYGLKQAPRCWNKKFADCLKKLELKSCEIDSCVMYRSEPFLILAIYVDDGIIFAKDKEEINKVKEHLKNNFEIHEVGLDSFLGFQIERKKDGSIFIHQEAYVRKILKKFDMHESTSVESPVVANRDKMILEEKLDSRIPFREAIGSLTYAATITRIDIACAVNRAARKVSGPTTSDWMDVKRIFRYLRGTEDYGILYSSDVADNLNVFVDADFAGCESTAKSTTGIVAMFTGGPVHWKSKRQLTVAKSSTEAELNGVSTATEDVLWLRKLCLEISIISNKPTTLHCDNQSAIRLGKNERVAERTRYMKVKAAFVREQIEDELMNLVYVKAEHQLADILTKPTLVKNFVCNRDKLMRSKSNLLRVALTIVTCLALLDKTDCLNFDRVNPLVWTSIENHVVLIEVRKVKIIWGQVNPCEGLAQMEGKGDVIKKLVDECNRIWREKWIDKLSQFTVKPKKFAPDVQAMLQGPMETIPGPHPTNPVKREIALVATSIISVTTYVVVTSLFAKIKYWIYGETDEQPKIREVEEHVRSLEHDSKEMKRIIGKLLENVSELNRKILNLEQDLFDMVDYFIVFHRISTKISQASSKLDIIIRTKDEGHLATHELRELTKIEDLNDIEPIDTTIESITYGEGVITINALLLIKSKDTHIYQANAFQYYNNLSNSPTLEKYTGTSHVIYNATSRCMAQIDLGTSRWIQRRCEENDYFDDYANEWESTKTFNNFTDMQPLYQHFNTLTDSYVYCFPANISINKTNYVCPPYVFKLPIDVSYRTGKLAHDTSFKMINVTETRISIERLDAGKFKENIYNSEQVKMIENSMELEVIRKQLQFKERDWRYVTVGGITSSGIILLIMIGYSLYKLYECTSSWRNVNSTASAPEFQLQNNNLELMRIPSYESAIAYPRLDGTPEKKRIKLEDKTNSQRVYKAEESQPI